MIRLSRLSLGALALVSAVGLAACGEETQTAQVDASSVRGAPMYVQEPEQPEDTTPEPNTPDPVEQTAPTAESDPVEPAPTDVEPVEPAAPDPAPAEGTAAQDPALPETPDATEPPAAEPDAPGPGADQPKTEPESPAVEEPKTDEPVIDEPEKAPADLGDLGDSDDQPAARTPTTVTEPGDGTVLTFDELASFVWVPPSDGTLDTGTGLGPPDGAEAGTAPKPDPAAGKGEHHVTPKGEETSEIPAKLRKFEGKVVSIEGYMIPLEFDEEGGVRKFILSRYMMGCCFGVVPSANELVVVTMTNEDGAVYEPYLTVLATGKFGIDSTGGEIGALKSLYAIEGQSCRFVLDR